MERSTSVTKKSPDCLVTRPTVPRGRCFLKQFINYLTNRPNPSTTLLGMMLVLIILTQVPSSVYIRRLFQQRLLQCACLLHPGPMHLPVAPWTDAPTCCTLGQCTNLLHHGPVTLPVAPTSCTLDLCTCLLHPRPVH